MRGLLSSAFLLLGAVAVAEKAGLSPEEINRAVALGRQCQAPIVRVSAGQFDTYIESPFARAALVAATATINHRPLDAPGVVGARTSDYRIWAVYTDEADRTVSVTRIGVRPLGGAEIAPARERALERLVLGIGGSHGIIEALRRRAGEAIFTDLPNDDFEVVLHTTAGVQRHRVTAKLRATLLRVCN